MEHTSHPNERTQGVRSDHTHQGREATRAWRLSIVRGLIFTGVAYLFGSCILPFGSMPLGFSVLCAPSSHVLYIWAGVCLSCIGPSFPLPFWAGWIIYTALLLLRLLISRLFSPKPTTKQRFISAMDKLTLWVERLSGEGEAHNADTATDYYYGRRNVPIKIDEDAGSEDTEEIDVPLRSCFGEGKGLRMLTATLGNFVFCLSVLVSGGFEAYDLLGFLFSLIIAPILTFLLIPCFEPMGEALLFSPAAPDVLPQRGHGHILKRYSLMTFVSVLLLLFFCVFGARQRSLTLYSPYVVLRLAPILATILALRITASKGWVPGMIVSVLCGLAADPLMSPAFILAVLCYGLLRFFSQKVAVVGGCLAAILWTLVGAGVEKLVAYLASMLLTLPLCLVLDKIFSGMSAADSFASKAEAMNDFSSAMAQKTRAEAHRSRLEALSEAFSSLSHVFYDLSGKLRKPKQTELRRMCDEVFDRHCSRCRYREQCDGAVCHPADLLAARLAAQLYSRGRVELAYLPPDTARMCPCIRSVMEDVNDRCARLTEHLMKSEKTEVFATDYESVADLIKDTLDADESEYRCNREAADQIFDWLTDRGVAVLGVMVCGKRNCRIIVRGTHFDRSGETLKSLQTAFEHICGTRLTMPSFEPEEDGSATSVMRLFSEPSFDAVYAGSTVSAGTKGKDGLPLPLTDQTEAGDYQPPDTCGDHIALFKSDNACFYALISDGMGSGEEASLTSDICALFLEKMLTAGNRVELSVRMLNSFIRQKNNGTGEECSATVDLMELDLMSGQAIFAKNGAAPTYVVRGGRVYKIRSRTLPIGILRDSDPELLRFRMYPGDVVVMVSDGVTNGNDECPWLIELLSSPLPDSMDSLRMKILRHAISSGSPDDLSAIAIRVEER